MLGLSFEPFLDGVQLVLDFDQYELSIVQHSGSYGGKNGLYEIAVFQNNMQVELPGITRKGDTVQGYLALSEVAAIVKKMHTITKTEPKKVSA
jgi:hypothetical protein